jgi:peroxiredoxin family protein/rhodanese-related sulfurtransferase/TusA-related sulfurtransferase
MATEETTIKSISPQQFLALDRSAVTLLDLREPDEVLVKGIDGAINIPFSKIANGLDAIPRDKPVYVFCRTGDWSSEVVEILTDRGYDAYNVEGGFQAYEEQLKKEQPIFIDATGLKCPGPIVKVADTLRELPVGRQVTIEATEDAFASDLAVWCERTGNRLVKLEAEPAHIHAVVEKAKKPSAAAAATEQNDKTFIVFSGDLDKTIAAFILANGAAAMGRKVTIFFTFWGLNILRRKEKVHVKKSFVEEMFGLMMPRGTEKLGLSRMNMGGMGAKMIRSVMKSKGINSLEELMENALRHGVRLVACQMSMDIMGIHQEELIDGVELGGVATFLGSGEQSDISLFI